jgi:hypothetical protein
MLDEIGQAIDHTSDENLIVDEREFLETTKFVGVAWISRRATQGLLGSLQPSAIAKCGKINPRRGIPSSRAIAGAKFQSDFLVAIGNPQWRARDRIWMSRSLRGGTGVSLALPRPPPRRRRLRCN